MSKINKLLVLALIAASIIAPNAIAKPNNQVSCSVLVTAGAETYQKDFIIQPDVNFSDDFSTATRFKSFDASTETVNGKTDVQIVYFNDVGVFDSIEFSTTLSFANGQKNATVSGGNRFFTSNRSITTNYTLNCSKD